MNKTNEFNRWLIVVGAILIQLCLGAIYAWSVFRIPLQEKLNISRTQASLPFSFVLIFFALATILGGRLQDKVGPRIVAIIGGILLGTGMILASFAHGLVALIVFYGVISGIGIGIAYVCPISAGVKWFPDKRGLITGLSVAGFGAGALIVAPIARILIETSGVFSAFRTLGLIFLFLVIVGAMMLRNPAPAYVPQGWTKSNNLITNNNHYSPKQMLTQGQFYLIWIMFFIGCATGLMIIGQTSPIGQEVANYSTKTAAFGVSLLAIFNAVGRIFWGRVSDLVNRVKVLFFIFVICGLASISYIFIYRFHAWYWVGISLVGLCFGGYLALFPAITADFFGTKNVGINYGFVFTAFGMGGLLSNIFAPRIKELTGGYTVAFIVTGILCFIGAFLAFLFKPPKTTNLAKLKK